MRQAARDQRLSGGFCEESVSKAFRPMDSAARVDQVTAAAYTRWPQSQRWPVRATRRERFSAEPPDQPTEELLEISDALWPGRWRIGQGSSHVANGCGIAVASPATGLIAACCSALQRSSAKLAIAPQTLLCGWVQIS